MREVLQRRIEEWLNDPESTVSYAEEVEGRWAVRITQEARDATTVWFRPLERSLVYEAYVLPIGDHAPSVLQQALNRNMRSWRAFFALDPEDGLILRGRLAAAEVTMETLDSVLGEIVETIEISFRPLLQALFTDRENSV